MVRFGNVLDSSGSVVPLFREQIRKRIAVTVTHPEITRYFMSIGEAARLVIQAGAMAEGGEVFLLDMGSAVKIRELAVQMIELSGFVPDRDIPIRFTDLRPGEKLYEELLIDPETARSTRHPRIFHSHEPLLETNFLDSNLIRLEEALSQNNIPKMSEHIMFLVPEYNLPKSLLEDSLRSSSLNLLN
jgi:FlaA1/EpsC-like NDP-sugar epimerase